MGSPAPDNGQDEHFVAQSPAAQKLLSTLERAAGVPSSVWLGGELGSGRTFAARALHQLGDTQGDRTFLVANPRRHINWPTAGTVVLPNVDALDADQQLALSRELRNAPQGVRVVATATDDGRQQVASGQLQPELYYQLAVVVVTIPPLRQRKEDIRPLFDAALAHYSERYGRPRPEVPERIYGDLLLHYWPGNIRELRNVAERAVVLGAQGLEVGVVPDTTALHPGLPQLEPGFNLSRYLEDVERNILEEALRQTGGDRNAAGRLLGVERNTLRYKLNKYDLLDRTNH
jgi:DNA-binding NtrC family response regulator